jgi:hypothetical protein
VTCAPQDSGGSRSDSDSSGDESDEEGGSAPGASGHDTRSQKLTGRKHKSDTVLQKGESKKSGSTSGEGSGNGPAEPKPLMITPDQLRALQTPGASLVIKPGELPFHKTSLKLTKVRAFHFQTRKRVQITKLWLSGGGIACSWRMRVHLSAWRLTRGLRM